MGKTYGYARVSTREQNLDRQLDALHEYGITDRCLFRDKATGANFDRPGFQGLMSKLREGDLVVVASVDRLGRDYGEIQEVWRRITKEIGADVEVLDMPLLNTRNSIEGLTGIFVADLVLQIMCYLAQMERDKTKERQREGIEAAKKRGVKFGPDSMPIPASFPEVHARYLNGEITRKEAAAILGVSASTFDRWRRAAGVPVPEDDAVIDSGSDAAWREAAGAVIGEKNTDADEPEAEDVEDIDGGADKDSRDGEACAKAVGVAEVDGDTLAAWEKAANVAETEVVNVAEVDSGAERAWREAAGLTSAENAEAAE